MQCKEIRELILTDYVDNRMTGEKRKETERHLAECPECKEFFTVVKKTAIEPFAGAGRLEAPGFIWQRTKDAIMAEQNEGAEAFGFLKNVMSALHIHKPVLAAVGAVVLMIAVGVTVQWQVNKQMAIRADARGEAEYFGYLTESYLDATINDEAGLGTSIEKYFL